MGRSLERVGRQELGTWDKMKKLDLGTRSQPELGDEVKKLDLGSRSKGSAVAGGGVEGVRGWQPAAVRVRRLGCQGPVVYQFDFVLPKDLLV